jgi:hypothetical protein
MSIVVSISIVAISIAMPASISISIIFIPGQLEGRGARPAPRSVAKQFSFHGPF